MKPETCGKCQVKRTTIVFGRIADLVGRKRVYWLVAAIVLPEPAGRSLEEISGDREPERSEPVLSDAA